MYKTKKRLVEYGKNEILYNIHYDMGLKLLTIVTKDAVTKKERVREIINPKRICYIQHNHIPQEKYYKEFEDVKNLKELYVDSSWYEYNIAKILGGRLEREIKMKEKKASDVFLDTRIFGADIPIETLYYMDYMDQDHIAGNDDIVPFEGVISKGYADIEIDSVRYKSVKVSDIHEKASDVPINALSYFNHDDRIMYVYALKNPEYKGIFKCMEDPEAFKKRVLDNTIQAIHDDANKSSKEVLLEGMKGVKIELQFFNNDWDLMQAYKQQAYIKDRVNILYFYNAAFDMKFMEHRFRNKGLDKLFSHPDFKYPKYNFRYKDKGFQKMKDRNHDFYSASYTKVLDQGIVYFGSRPQTVYASEALNEVVKNVTGLSKLSYAHICDHMLDLVRLDFMTFLEYNIRDVFAQYFVELVVDDTSTSLAKTFATRCPFASVNGAMPSVTATFFYDARRSGQIVSCEVNRYIMAKFSGDTTKLYNKMARKYFRQNGKQPAEKLAKLMKLEAGRSLLLPQNRPNWLHPDDVFQLEHYSNLCAPPIEGGVVGDSTKIALEGVELVPGHPSKFLFDTVVDFDLKSHYPNTIISGNISRQSLFDQIKDVDYRNLDDKEVGNIISVLIDGDPIRMGKDLFGLPTLEDMLQIKKEDINEHNGNKKLIVDKDNIATITKVNNFLRGLNNDVVDVSDDKGKYLVEGDIVYVASLGRLVSVVGLGDVFKVDGVVDGNALSKEITANKKLITKAGDVLHFSLEDVSSYTVPDLIEGDKLIEISEAQFRDAMLTRELIVEDKLYLLDIDYKPLSIIKDNIRKIDISVGAISLLNVYLINKTLVKGKDIEITISIPLV